MKTTVEKKDNAKKTRLDKTNNIESNIMNSTKLTENKWLKSHYYPALHIKTVQCTIKYSNIFVSLVRNNEI